MNTLAQEAASFSVQPEATAKYGFLADPYVGNPMVFINQVYQNLFNRDADPAGLAYWTARLEASKGNPNAVGAFILDVISGATGADDIAIRSKVEVARDFTVKISNAALTWNDTMAAQSVTQIEATTTPAQAEAQKAVTTEFIASGAYTGITYTVTAADATVPEGQPEVFTIATTGVAAGTKLAYTITGTGSAAGSTTAGEVILDASGKAVVTITVPVDPTVGNVGTLQLSLANGKASSPIVAVTDTSNGVYTLTAYPDTATAQIFLAPQVYTPGGTDLINSLQNEDRLTGDRSLGATSLTGDIGNDNDNGYHVIAPSITNVDTINIAFTNTSENFTLDFQDITGTSTANITRISANLRESFANLKGEVTTLGISNTSEQARVTITYLNNELSAANNAVTLNLNNASFANSVVDCEMAGGALKILATEARGSELQHQIERYDIVTRGGASSIATFETGVSSFDDLVVGERPVTVNIDAGASLAVGTLRWLANRVETMSANPFQADGLHQVQLNGEGFVNHEQITRIAVTGAANVTLANVGDWETDADADSDVDFTLDASTATGDLTADISNAANSSDASFIGGLGSERFYVGGPAILPGAVVATPGGVEVDALVSGGAGPAIDTLTVQSNNGTTVTGINLKVGSTGMDVLNLVQGLNTDSDSTWNTDLADGGFSTVTFNNQSTSKMTNVLTGFNASAQALSVRSVGFDGRGNPVSTERGHVDISFTQQAAVVGGTVGLELGHVSEDRGVTDAFSWENRTSTVKLIDSTATGATNAAQNLNLQLNSAALAAGVPTAIRLHLNDGDFVNTMTVTTGTGITNEFNAGSREYAPGEAIGAQTYNGSLYNGNQNLVFGGTQGRQAGLLGVTGYAGQSVSTGNGADFIDLSYITTDTSNTAGGYLASTFLLNSSVSAAGGSDTVVLSADLSDPRPVLLQDPTFDEWFQNWSSVEHLIVNGRNAPHGGISLASPASSSYVAYDWDAQAAGLQDISFTATDNSTTGNSSVGRLGAATIFLGEHYTGNPTAASTFTINSNVSALQVIDSRSLVNIVANINNPVVDVLIRSTGASIVDPVDNNFRLNYNNIDGALNIVGGANLLVERGSLDYVDFNGTTDGANTISVVTNDDLTAPDEVTTYDFTGIVNAVAGTTGTVEFDASGETNTPGLTILGSTDGGSLPSGNVSNLIVGSDGTFLNGYGNDTITTGGYQDVVCAQGGNDTVTYTNNTAAIASSISAWGEAGNDVITATIGSINGTAYLDGGIDDDVLTVSGNGSATLFGGLGSDVLVETYSALDGQDIFIGGENSDTVTISGVDSDWVVQGLYDGERATASNFGVDLVITAGDTMTFTDGVDVVYGFNAAGGDVLVGDIQISRSLMGQNADNLLTSGWLSGTYNVATGRFTVAANGAGPDAAFIQKTGPGNANLVVGNGEARNENVVILKGVDTDDFTNENFALGGVIDGSGDCEDVAEVIGFDQGVTGENVIPTFVGGVLALENGSWTDGRLYIDAYSGGVSPTLVASVGGGFYSDDAYTTLAGDVAPNPVPGFDPALLVAVDFSNLGGSATNAAPSVGVEVELSGAASPLLASVVTTNGDDVIREASENFGAATSSIDGDAGVDAIVFDTYGTQTLMGNGTGRSIRNIEQIDLLAGATGLTLDDTVNTPVLVQNVSGLPTLADAAATVNLGAGSTHSYWSDSDLADTVTLGLSGQTATLINGGTVDVIAGSVLGASVTTDGTALAVGTVASMAGNYTTTNASASTLNVTGGTGGSVILGSIVGFDNLAFSANSGALSVTSGAINSLTGVSFTSGAPVSYSASLAQLDGMTSWVDTGANTFSIIATGAGGTLNLAGMTLTNTDVLSVAAVTSAVTITGTAALIASFGTIAGATGFATTLTSTDDNALDLSGMTLTDIDTINFAGSEPGTDQLTLAQTQLASAGITAINGTGTASGLIFDLDANTDLTSTVVTDMATIDVSAGVADTLTLNAASIVGATTLIGDAGSILNLSDSGDYENLTINAGDFTDLVVVDDTSVSVSEAMFGGAIDEVDGDGSGDAPLLTINMVGTSLNLGGVAFASNDAIDTDINGTSGNDIIELAASKAAGSSMTVNNSTGVDEFRFNPLSGNEDDAMVLGDAVSITNFNGDKLSVDTADLTVDSFASVAQNGWDLDDNGYVFINNTSVDDFTSLTALSASVGTVANIADGDETYVAISNSAATQVALYRIVFDLDAAETVIDAGDTVTLVGIADITGGTFGLTNMGLYS